jgi:hypothetical protein
LSGSLYRIPCILNDPGKRRFFDGKAQRINDVIGFEMCNFHGFPHEYGIKKRNHPTKMKAVIETN